MILLSGTGDAELKKTSNGSVISDLLAKRSERLRFVSIPVARDIRTRPE